MAVVPLLSVSLRRFQELEILLVPLLSVSLRRALKNAFSEDK